MPFFRHPKDALALLLAVLSWVALALPAYWYAERRSLDELHRTLAPRAELYAATIGGAIDKYEFLPLAIAQRDEVIDLLHSGDPRQVPRINAYLEDINRRAGAFAVYVLDLHGKTLASSNWRERTSYVNQNYGFRPYFQLAAGGDIGRYYGIGLSTREPGYFIARAVRRDGRIVGVAAAKVSLGWLEQSWSPGVAEELWVNDANGVVILSSRQEWKFKSLRPLSEAARRMMDEQRQFFTEPLAPLAYAVREQFADGTQVLALPEPAAAGGKSDGKVHEYLAVSRKLAPLDWQITVLSDLAPVRNAARGAALAASLAWAVALLGALYWRQKRRRLRERFAAEAALKRANDQLEMKVGQRTADLVLSNRQLQAEIAERQQAEETLRTTQAELVQRGKLAAIGQMAAGITHELNQPLAAMRSFSDNAAVLIQRGRTDEALENLSIISSLVDRLGRITAQLKGFARRRDQATQAVRLDLAFTQAMQQLRPRLQAESVRLSASWPEPPLWVRCSAIGLEQVFANILANALDAMAGSEPKEITVSAGSNGTQAEIRLRDNGPGIAPATLDKLFEPFFTTKEAGLGLGLAICAGIIRAAGGRLSAHNVGADGRQAEFLIELPLAPSDQENEEKT